MEDLRGRGKLEVFYEPDGFGDALLNYPRTLESSQVIEADNVEFGGNLNFDTYRFYMRLRETVVATRPFSFAGRSWRTPDSGTAWDMLVGEYSDGFFGVAMASNNAMPPLSPQEKLIALVGPPQRVMRY